MYEHGKTTSTGGTEEKQKFVWFNQQSEALGKRIN